MCGVRHRRGEARLAQEALAPLHVRREIGPQDLERDGALELLVERLVDDAHPPLAELPDDPEVRELLDPLGDHRAILHRARRVAS